MARKLHQSGAGTQKQDPNLSGADDGADEDDDLGDALDELLDDDELDEGDDDEQDDEEGAEDGEQESAEDKLFGRIEALIDRRITGLVRTMDRKYGKPTDAQQQQARQRRSQQEAQPQQQAPVVNEREARLAYKDFIGDRIRFGSAEERSAANELAIGLIAAEIAKGADDADEIGETVAEKVATRILSLRKHYGSRTKAALRAQGVLPPQRDQQGTAGRTGAPQARSQFQKGRQMAAARHPRPE